MPQIQPPNTQTLRPQFLTQVGHEGNPVETCAVEIDGSLNSPNPFECEGEDLGGPVIYPVVGSGGGGGGGSSAPVIPLVLGGGSMDCTGSQSVTITVTGGVGPYVFETTLGILTVESPTTVILTPPANPGSAYAPTSIAFARNNKYIFSCVGGGACACRLEGYNCAGVLVRSCTSSGTNDCMAECNPAWHCSGFFNTTTPKPTARTSAAAACFTSLPIIDQCAINANTICSCDRRTQDMIDNQCQPCDVAFTSAVVTVTDSEGRNAYITIERNVNIAGAE